MPACLLCRPQAIARLILKGLPPEKFPILQNLCYDGLLTQADVAELVDALDLGSSFARSEGSSPFIRIIFR
jgi:hypothetical protein